MAWESSERSSRVSLEYEANRLAALDRDGETCRIQGAGCLMLATEVDHRIPTAEGGGDNLENLQSVCSVCHSEKTQRESWRGRQRRKRRAQHPSSLMRHPGLA